MKYDIVIPISQKDMPILIKNLKFIEANIEHRNIIIIGNEKVYTENVDVFTNNIIFKNEDNIIEGLNFQNISAMLIEKCNNSRRTGWYFQQFLKLGYAINCIDEFYLVWDADTIPLRPLNFYENGVALFNLKNEYNKPYFTCIDKLLSIKKKNCIKESFISEHMLFSTKRVLEMISLIENNQNIEGHSFFEKIINSIDIKFMNQSGFSEYETYGCFMYTYHKDEMKIRKLNTFRHGKVILGENPNNETLEWCSKSCDTISFEKFDKPHKKWNKYVSRDYQASHSFSDLCKRYSFILEMRDNIIMLIRRIVR